jgi:hypothetical protein
LGSSLQDDTPFDVSKMSREAIKSFLKKIVEATGVRNGMGQFEDMIKKLSQT